MVSSTTVKITSITHPVVNIIEILTAVSYAFS